MDDPWWLGLGKKVLDAVPAIAGAIVSLRYMDEKVKGILLLSAFVSSVVCGIYLGFAVVAHYGIKDQSIANLMLFVCGAFGLVGMTKIYSTITKLSPKEIIEFLKSALRKWVN